MFVPADKKRKMDIVKPDRQIRSLSSSPELQPRPLFSVGEDSKESLDLKADIKLEEDSEATDIEEPAETDAGEFALEMGLACVVCKQIDVINGNGLIECQGKHVEDLARKKNKNSTPFDLLVQNFLKLISIIVSIPCS